MSGRQCAGPGCDRSLEGRHAAVRYCSGRCRTRAFRTRQEAQEGGQLRYTDPTPMEGTPGVTGSPVTAIERREHRRQQARERITRNIQAILRDFAYLVDRNENDRAKSAYLELVEATERAVALVEEHNRRAEIRERAMTMRPREDR